jgi:O-antigen/teichoic acid export membrane protein
MSESLTSRMFGGTILLGIGSVLSMGAGLASTMLAARYFSTAIYGAFVLLEVVVSFLTQVSGFGLELSIARFVAGAEEDSEKRDLAGTAIVFRLSVVVMASMVATLARDPLARLFGGAALLADLIAFLPLLLLLYGLRTLLRAILEGYLQFSRIAIADCIGSLLNLFLLSGYVLFAGQDIIGLILARTGALLAACTFAFLSIARQGRLSFRFDLLKGLARFGLPLGLNDVLTFVFMRIDTLIIAALLGPSEVAFYEIARRIPDSLRKLYEPFRSVYFAVLSRLFALRKEDEVAALLNESIRVVSVGTLLGSVVAILFGRDIIVAVFSGKYLSSAPAFSLLMINLSIALVGNVLGTSLVAMGDSEKPAIINVVHTAVSVLGAVLLIPSMGIMGAAAASLVGVVSAYPLSMAFVRRRATSIGVGPYLKQVAVFSSWVGLALVLRPTDLLPRMGLLLLFAVLCVVFSIVSKSDLTVVVAEVRGTSWEPVKRLLRGRVRA